MAIGDVVERATGMPLAAWLEQALWQPAGMAHDGVWHAYQQGKHDVGAHGFNATLEDWGRFGEFVARDGRPANGQRRVPEGWFDQSSARLRRRNQSPRHTRKAFTAINGGITRFRPTRSTSTLPLARG